MNWQRGFRRLGWVATAVALPVAGVLSYAASEHRVGFEPKLLTGDFPAPGDTSKQVVTVGDVGVFYFSPYLSKADMEEQMRSVHAKAAGLQLPNLGGRLSVEAFALSIRAKYPGAYDDLDAVDLTRRVLAKYPEYRDKVNFRQYEVEAKYAKRPMWAAGITLAVTGALAVLLQGSISVVAWILRGFSRAE